MDFPGKFRLKWCNLVVIVLKMVRWCNRYGGPQLSRQNKIQSKKIKFRRTNWNYSRQTTNIHGKNKNSRHYPEFVITRANCSRQKQIAHGKSQNGGQRFLVSGRPSTWCNTTRSLRFPAFFGNVVIMFCSKCGCSLKEIDNFCSSCGKGKFSHFYNHLLGLSTRLFGKRQHNFHVAHVLCVCVF